VYKKFIFTKYHILSFKTIQINFIAKKYLKANLSKTYYKFHADFFAFNENIGD